jgi:hypothetical protein
MDREKSGNDDKIVHSTKFVNSKSYLASYHSFSFCININMLVICLDFPDIFDEDDLR